MSAVYIYMKEGVEVARNTTGLSPIGYRGTRLIQTLWYNILYEDKQGKSHQHPMTLEEWEGVAKNNADPIAGLLVLLNAVRVELYGVEFDTHNGIQMSHLKKFIKTEESALIKSAKVEWNNLIAGRLQSDPNRYHELLNTARAIGRPQKEINLLWVTLKIHRVYELLYGGRNVKD